MLEEHLPFAMRDRIRLSKGMIMTMRSRALLVLASMMLSACGGGGSGDSAQSCVSGIPGLCSMLGATPPTPPGTSAPPPQTSAAPTVSLAFVNSDGAPSNSLTAATPLTIKATVLDADKKPVPNSVVSFATNDALAVFSPTSGTALTDVNGIASVSMRTANLAAAGAGTVIASSTVGTTTITGNANYAVSATPLSFGTLSASPANIQAYGSTVLSVDIMNGASKYTDQQVNVSFSSACVTAGRASLAASAPSNNGTVQAVYRDKGCANNDTVTVSAEGVAKPATAALTIAPPTAASLQFVQAVPTDKSIVIKNQGGNGRTETAVLTFKVVDIFGNPLAGKQVNFSRVPANADIVLNKATDTSDADGVVVTTVNSGTTPLSFRVLATLPSSGSGSAEISILSDSVVVTTGLPAKRWFSLSAGSFNVEGWNRDSSPTDPATHIQLLLADEFGNPVPDGTPVVFQTNVGSVGSSDKGGCNTVNGGCSVDFRAQEPRIPAPNTPITACNTGHETSTPDIIRPGLATICASTTDGAQTMFGKISVFLSGGEALRTTMNGVRVSFNAPNDLGSVSANATRMFQLHINDINDNPMPVGTKVELTSVFNANAATVAPVTVPNIAPHGPNGDDTGNTIAGPQGSMHTFGISSTTPTECKGPVEATFNVTITTPAGKVTTIPFRLLFTCP